jgi:succinyl-diaminopimelate desuccinylase
VSTTGDARLLDHPALGEQYLTDVLRRLVGTPSVNPGTPETAMAAAVEELLAPLALEMQRIEFAPGRASVGARLRGTGDGPTLILNGHMDTVPVDDLSLWTTDPFAGEVKDGFLYGRGACDMKAGLTIAIGVAHAIASLDGALPGSLVLHFAAGEERGEPGTLSLLDAGFTGDLGITLEPTELQVHAASRGAAFIRIRIKGRSIHASRARFGVNPIAELEPVLNMLDAYDRELAQDSHPLLPGGSITPTTVVSGVKENAVPDSLELTVDRRFLPADSAADDLEELRRRLEAIRADRPSFEFEVEHMFPAIEGAEVPPDSFLARSLVETAERVTGVRPEVAGSPGGSDVRNLVRDHGIEALMYGPGNVLECHCVDERVQIAQVRHVALVVAAFAQEYLSGGAR